MNASAPAQLADLQQQLDALTAENALLHDTLAEVTAKLQPAIAEAHRTRDLLERHQQEHRDSLRYARRIQQALLPGRNAIAQHFADLCLFYQPKDEVSGDFYWIHQRGPQLLLGVLDCTGHGVPGAFLSVLGHNVLGKLAETAETLAPDVLLNQMDEEIRSILNQDATDAQALDGIDITLVLIDTQQRTLQFSLAHQKAYVLQQGQTWQTVSGDKMSVGTRNKPVGSFGVYTLPYQPGDRLFLFTDGITDQFGSGNKKYLYKRFFNFLTQRADRPLHELEQSLRRELDAWRGHLAQTDDMLALAVELR